MISKGDRHSNCVVAMGSPSSHSISLKSLLRTTVDARLLSLTQVTFLTESSMESHCISSLKLFVIAIAVFSSVDSQSEILDCDRLDGSQQALCEMLARCTYVESSGVRAKCFNDALQVGAVIESSRAEPVTSASTRPSAQTNEIERRVPPRQGSSDRQTSMRTERGADTRVKANVPAPAPESGTRSSASVIASEKRSGISKLAGLFRRIN